MWARSVKQTELKKSQMGVVNRDIKLENTLLDGGRRPLLKICDFGYSKNEKDSLPKSKVGTPGYTGKRCPTLLLQLLQAVEMPSAFACLLVHPGCSTRDLGQQSTL